MKEVRVVELEAEVKALKEWRGKVLPYLYECLLGYIEAALLDEESAKGCDDLAALITEGDYTDQDKLCYTDTTQETINRFLTSC